VLGFGNFGFQVDTQAYAIIHAQVNRHPGADQGATRRQGEILKRRIR
jgi:hypothetical protein